MEVKAVLIGAKLGSRGFLGGLPTEATNIIAGKVIPRHCGLVTHNQRVNWTAFAIRVMFWLFFYMTYWSHGLLGRHMCVYRLKCSSGNGRHEQDSDFWHQLPSRPPLPCVGRLCVPCYTLTIHQTCVGHPTYTLLMFSSTGYILMNPMERWQYLQLT